MQHLFLIRHAATEAIESHLMQGATESPLSRRGQAEAHLTAARLGSVRFNAAFSSPMWRALETASILASAHPGLHVILLDSLHEMDFGFYERKPYFASPDEVPHGFRRLNLLAKVLLAQITGESLRSVSRRAVLSWDQITAAAPEGTVLIVSHGVLLHYLLKFLLPGALFQSLQPVSLRPCSITELAVTSPGSAEIIRSNDTSHLN